MAAPSASLVSDCRAIAVFHLADVTGPAKTLRPRLEALTREGALEVLAPGDGSLSSAYSGLGRVRSLPYEPLTFPGSLRGLATAAARFARDVRLFRRELRRDRPDLVVVVTTHLPAVLLAAWLERVPRVVYVGEVLPSRESGAARSLGGRALARLSELLADRLVCCSQTVANQFDGRGETATIYPGISSVYGQGDGATFRDRHGLDGAGPVIAMVGNLTEGRAQDTAVRALAAIRERLPGARLVIAGLPHPRPRDQAFAADVHGLARDLEVEGSVVFAGFVERIADVYAAADVVVNPARFSEAFGRVAFEAFMAGRPVVASAVGAVPEVLHHGRDALLVPPDDHHALAEAIFALVDDPTLRDRLVAEGTRRVQTQFGEDLGVEAFGRVVADVLGERSNGARSPVGATR